MKHQRGSQTASRLFGDMGYGDSAVRLYDADHILPANLLRHSDVDKKASTGRPIEQKTASQALSAASEQIKSFSNRLLLLTPFQMQEDLGITLQEWEGCVYHVGDVSFSARLVDRTKGGVHDTEIAEIPIEEVDEGDIDLLKPGGIFYLTVRRRILRGGRHEVGSRIIFRRMPAWSKTALVNAEAEATKLAKYFADE